VLGVVLNCVDLQHPNYSYYGQYGAYYSTGDNNDTGDVRNGNGLDAAIQQLKGDISRPHNTNGSAGTLAGQEIIKEQDDIVEIPSKLRSSVKIAKENIQKPIDPEIIEVVDEHSSNQNAATDLMPRESLDRLIAAVTKSIGPIAPFVVHEQIRTLGESYSAFPKSRIGELVKLIQQEIERTKTSQA
jgi:hypothetical protein